MVTDTFKEMLEALLKAKSQFKQVNKNAINPFLGNRYATLAHILDSIEPALMEQGFFITHFLDEAQSSLVTQIVHVKTGESLKCSVKLLLKESDNMQALGSAITYARRYSLLMLLGLSVDDDDDGNTASGVHAKQAPTTQAAQPKGAFQPKSQSVSKPGPFPAKTGNKNPFY